MIKRMSAIYRDDINNEILDRKEESRDMNVSLLDLVTESNSLYLESSVFEDCILNKYLKIYTQVKDISFSNKPSYSFVDSFISEDYLDKDFAVDNRLNLDILNGDLTLPIKEENTLTVSNIIIENTSNGTIGTSIGTEKYNDITSILTADSSKLFLYENILSDISTKDLVLNITLKLSKEDICNALYIKMYNDENTNYPNVYSVKTSLDGVSFTEASNVTSIENKSDRYIRFKPSYIRYISISFKQNTYSTIQTNFGSRFRYIIGLREVTPKKVEYMQSGEYVSKSITTQSNVNSIYFSTSDISNSDIKYYLSANNGSKWIELLNNQYNILEQSELGLEITDDIEALRIKIKEDKENIKFGIEESSEFIDASLTNTYYLSNNPTSISAYIGNHISYGNKFIYNKTITTPLASGTIDVMLNYIPYDTVTNNLIIESGGRTLSSGLYTINKDVYDSTNSILRIDSSYISSGLISIYYAPIEYNGANGNKITLPQNMFFDNTESITVYSTDTSNNIKILQSSDIEIIDKKTIRIKESSYNNEYKYTVLYNPQIKINDNIDISNNKISIPSMKRVNTQYKMRFDYTYETEEDTELAKYYTPICKEYRIDFL